MHSPTRVSVRNKNYKLVYVCAFVGYWILSENARWKQYKIYTYCCFRGNLQFLQANAGIVPLITFN
jgi:hypothetical protein